MPYAGRAGLEVEEAGDGEAAFAAFRARPADAVVCDLFLPAMNEIELMNELARDFGDVRFVAISGGAGATAGTTCSRRPGSAVPGLC